MRHFCGTLVTLMTHSLKKQSLIHILFYTNIKRFEELYDINPFRSTRRFPIKLSKLKPKADKINNDFNCTNVYIGKDNKGFRTVPSIHFYKNILIKFFFTPLLKETTAFFPF